MDIVGGFDVHRKQITFDYIEMISGEVHRGKIRPATRQSLREWLDEFTQRFSAKQIAIAVEATTGWRYVVEELRRAGVAAHLAEPAETRSMEGRAHLEDMELPAAARKVVDLSLAMIEHINEELAPIEKELRAYARSQAGCKALMEHYYGVGECVRISIEVSKLQGFSPQGDTAK